MVRNPSANAGDTRDTSSIPGSGRSPVVGNGNPLQYPCLENPMDRGAWQAMVHWVTKSWTQLSMHASTTAYKIDKKQGFTVQLRDLYSIYGNNLHGKESKIIYAAAAKSLESCSTLCNPIDGSPPGSPAPGILQARTLE